MIMRRRAGRLFAASLASVALVLGSCTTTLTRDELATEYYNVGSAYFELGELEKSATYLARALELSPDLARASYNLARVYVQQRRYGDASDLLESLLQSDPDNSLVLETLGYARYEAGDTAGAAAWYDRALEVNPTDVELLQNRATVALRNDRPELAAQHLRRATDLQPGSPDLLRRLARAESLAGDAVAAIDAYADYVDVSQDPEPAALLEYAQLLVEHEFYADALSVLDRVGEIEGVPAETEARAAFERARLFLTVAEEAELGLEALRSALTLGFRDQDAVSELLDSDALVARADVEAAVRAAGLIGADARDDSGGSGEGDSPADDADAPSAGSGGDTGTGD